MRVLSPKTEPLAAESLITSYPFAPLRDCFFKKIIRVETERKKVECALLIICAPPDPHNFFPFRNFACATPAKKPLNFTQWENRFMM